MLMVFVLLTYIFTSSLCINVYCLLGDNIEVKPYCKMAHYHLWINRLVLCSVCVYKDVAFKLLVLCVILILMLIFFRTMTMTMNLKMQEINGRKEKRGRLGVRTKREKRKRRRKRQIVEM